jgi:drug/metabolite transporter (DMT)-like permease
MSPILGLLLVVLFWGGNFTASKIALAEIPPLPFTAIRFAVGSVLLGLVILRREGRLHPPRGNFLRLLLLGLVGNTVYQVLFIHGLALTSATNSALILASMPTVVTVGAGLLGMESVSRRGVLGLVVASAGVLLVIVARGGSLGGGHAGDALMLGAVLCWALYTLGLRRMGSIGLSPLELTGWSMILGTPVLVLLGVPGLVALPWGRISAAAWVGLAYATLLSLVAAYVLWSLAVQALGASRTALVSLLTPFVATTIATLMLGERPGPVHLAGGALIVSGVLLARTAAPVIAPAEEG